MHNPLMNDLNSLLACPRCDKTPLESSPQQLHCAACKVDFPIIDGMPWLFAEPMAAMGEWRGRLRFSLQQLGTEIESLQAELADKNLSASARNRVAHYEGALQQHLGKLELMFECFDVQTLSAKIESYLALRTRLPTDQGLNTYYANVHRDWAWGEAENSASLGEIEKVVGAREALGNTLVLGAGAGRLAYDIHQRFDCDRTIAMDFNPLLMLVANAVTRGDTLDLYEFPIAPLTANDAAVLRQLSAPVPVDDAFHLVFADALRAPFAAKSFDTVVTPWLIDVIEEDLPLLATRINHLLKDQGRWINFGSLAFSSPKRSRCYSTAETLEIVQDQGFTLLADAEATLPYMCSPASRHGRRETVFSFAVEKHKTVKKVARYTALPEWIVTAKEPVPLSAAFRQQAMTTQIYSFIMSLIDGKRSIKDMAVVLESQKLMSKEEAEASIRSFMTRMHDDANRQARF